MLRTVLALGLAVVGGMALFAQVQPSVPTQEGARPPLDLMMKTVTMSGCVREVSDAPGQFALVAEPARTTKPEAPPDSVPTPAAMPAEAAAKKVVRLIADGAGLDLSQHVNHTVEVTGRMKASTAPATANAPDAPIHAADLEAAPTMTVAQARPVSGDCDKGLVR